MLFTGIRIGILILVSVLLVYRIRKSHIARKRLTACISVAVCFILVALSAMFPLENLFFRFSSAEQVFRYTQTGTVKQIVYGEDSALVVYQDHTGAESFLVVPGADQEYRIPNYFFKERICYHMDWDALFSYWIYHAQGTQDYYVIGFCFVEGREVEVSDSMGREIVATGRYEESQNETCISFYAYTDQISDSYFLLINGEKYAINP